MSEFFPELADIGVEFADHMSDPVVDEVFEQVAQFDQYLKSKQGDVSRDEIIATIQELDAKWPYNQTWLQIDGDGLAMRTLEDREMTVTSAHGTAKSLGFVLAQLPDSFDGAPKYFEPAISMLFETPTTDDMPPHFFICRPSDVEIQFPFQSDQAIARRLNFLYPEDMAKFESALSVSDDETLQVLALQDVKFVAETDAEASVLASSLQRYANSRVKFDHMGYTAPLHGASYNSDLSKVPLTISSQRIIDLGEDPNTYLVRPGLITFLPDIEEYDGEDFILRPHISMVVEGGTKTAPTMDLIIPARRIGGLLPVRNILQQVRLQAQNRPDSSQD